MLNLLERIFRLAPDVEAKFIRWCAEDAARNLLYAQSEDRWLVRLSIARTRDAATGETAADAAADAAVSAAMNASGGGERDFTAAGVAACERQDAALYAILRGERP